MCALPLKGEEDVFHLEVEITKHFAHLTDLI